MERFKLSLEYREKVGYLLVIVMLVVLSLGLFKLQIFQYRDLSEQSEKNRIRVEPILPRRGIVTDRFGKIIIDNRPSYTVSIIPSEIVDGKTIENLAELINLDSTQIVKRLKRNMISRYQQTPIKRDIPFETVAILEEQSNRFPGVTYQMERVRQYNHELNAETYTGYVGEISEDELKGRDPLLYHLGSITGKKGLEKQYDEILRGREGTNYIEVTASGQIIGEYPDKESTEAIPGANLVLSIDNELQLACTKALDTFCCGAIVAMDPRNGEILAMTSYPGYDANIFSSVIPESLWTEIRTDSTHPLLNRPLNGLYPPGSTVKFVGVGAGLEEGAVTENSIFKPCIGGYQFGNRFFRCWDPGGHGTLNAAHTLEQSCDVYMYQLGLKLGIDKLAEYYAACGFGSLTNVDLPREAKGLNPTTEYYDERYGKKKWTLGLVLNNSIGQGELLVTPLQLAQFFCGLANDGVVYQPHLVKKINRFNGIETEIQPKVAFNLPFSSNTMRILREGLMLVVEGEHGTAKRLKNEYYSIGGKTGTAENPHGENHSWFAGVAPLDNPEIIVVAIVENAGHGSEVAAPLVGSVIQSYMYRKLGIDVSDSIVVEKGLGQL
ncbi:MAG: penicillin-binding protein 2 [Calditrichaeota bacterium]|nr:MAG: penicillin-binding protein 2 [Calditrichota bacterium]